MLYGNLGETGVSNKRNGPPVDISGVRLSGSDVDDAQPPFLLRWSPDFFAQHAPDVFSYEATTNRVSLQPAHCERPPWKAAQHQCQKSAKASWLYCDACHSRLFGKADVSHVPFADSASQAHLRNVDVAACASHDIVPPAVGEKWQRTIARVSRAVRRRRRCLFEVENLVPHPEPQYWQNVPAASFGELSTDAAHGVLACCNLQTSMMDHRDAWGRAAYK